MLFFVTIIILSQLISVIMGDLYKDLKVSCKSENRENIDWFYLYKFPKWQVEKDKTFIPNGKEGYQYMFLTSEHHNNWKLSNITINASDSMPALTLQPLFDDVSNILLIAYNDEHPDGTLKAYGAHAKGIVATDGVTGLWLIHSVPKFPEVGRYEYPLTGTIYGQNFLCFTCSASEMEKIGEQLLVNAPQIYYKNIPVSLRGKFPSLEAAINKKWNLTKPYYNVREVNSLGGTQFKTFAKSRKLEKELYEDIMAPELGSNLLVQSWRNGGGNIASNCSLSYKVFNVVDIANNEMNIDFKATQDHSKWAVSTPPTGIKLFHWRISGQSQNWICVGDINRQQGQFHRGGGQVCQKHKKVSKLYRSLIKNYEKC